MASRQDRREASAEAHSRRAAEELKRARDERVAQAEVDARTAADEIARARSDRAEGALSGAHATDYSRGGGGGILEGAKNFMSAVGRTFGGATDVAADKTSQTARATGDKLGEYRDYTADKARETNDSVAQKTNETAEATRNKLGEYKDAAVEKASETADATKNKLGEGTAQDARDRSRATAQSAADKARDTAATHEADRSQGPGLLGALGNVTGAIKDKLTLGGGHDVRLGGEDERAFPHSLYGASSKCLCSSALLLKESAASFRAMCLCDLLVIGVAGRMMGTCKVVLIFVCADLCAEIRQRVTCNSASAARVGFGEQRPWQPAPSPRRQA
uniref:Late embryogenesis abundant n=1 Tax=Cleistogenes songorica TaxID=121774 RepID=A0A2S1WLW7_9POAL|nr:late embryogenesis abundant [Cleistogenes songorica]